MKQPDAHSIMMLHLHALQTKLWSEELIPVVNYDYKALINQCRMTTKRLIDYHMSIMEDDDYEESAKISDCLYQMAKLPSKKITELSKIMENFILENQQVNK